MKKSLFAFSAVFILVIVFASCKKEDNANQPQSVKILGKWQVGTSVYVENHNGVVSRDTITAAAGDYLDFQAGGILKTRLTEHGETSETTSHYFMPNDQNVSLVIEGDTTHCSIQTLTTNSLILYNTFQDTHAAYSYQNTITLKK